MAEPKRSLLVISGLDPGGGAGFIADVRVAAAHGLRAIGVVTALTEQDTRGVRAVHPVPAEVIGDQLRALLADIEVCAVKIGMLGNEEVARVVAEALNAVGPAAVWDPIVRPTSGRVPLYLGDPVRAAEILAPHIGVITPNVPEAEALTGQRIAGVADMHGAARAVRALVGGADVLLKGGHLPGHQATDVLLTRAGPKAHGVKHGVEHGVERCVELHSELLALDEPVHGTGCALSTALACQLGLGADMDSAARAAKRYVAERLRAPVRPGRGGAAVL
jgi:hydroxymethylpyrimidine/phosphomethylpyrimidine kinase